MKGYHVEPGSMIRHPRNPLEMECEDARAVYPLAFKYVRTVAHHLGLRKELLGGLSQPPLKDWTAADPGAAPDGVVLRWFAFDPPGGADPRNSFFSERKQPGRDAEQTGILYAGACLKGENRVHFSMPRLRVVFHVFTRNKKSYVRFTGMSMTSADSPPQHGELAPYAKPRGAAAKALVRVSGEVFPLDPASTPGIDPMDAVAPNRSSAVLKQAQKSQSLGLLPQVHAGSVALAGDYVHVFNSPVADAGADEDLAKEVAVVAEKGGAELKTAETRARSNDFAAISAYCHGRSMFQLMEDHGLDPQRYFRCAELPVGIEYRSDFEQGTGNVRNADVRWAMPPGLARRGRILMRFGLADLTGSPSESPLGLACDVRWYWHELSHVLLMAAVGEREFRFCHSAGDALAAVLCDPRSRLAKDEHWGGVTIPWARLTRERRHDRLPDKGWAWGGPLDRPEEGYWQEQILSSTLFRIYKALGGWSAGEQTRLAAAEYTAYLVIRAIGLLGPAAVVPAGSADQFASALIDADIGTSVLAMRAGPGRVGGSAHKVVRWAFEQQGMYAPPGGNPGGPGEPEPVDVYVAHDLDGGYRVAPPDPRLPKPRYRIDFADPRAERSNPVRVKVANRGTLPASDVRVALWAAPAANGAPDWPGENGMPGAWQKVGERGCDIPARKSDGSSAAVSVDFSWKPAGPGRYLLLAAATCEDDRAITDANTRLPCALRGAPFEQLVMGDNNLGFAEALVESALPRSKR
jgi:hypothetical protein